MSKSEFSERMRLAMLYAHGALSPADAGSIIHECQPIAGWYPIETLSVDSVLDLAIDRYGDNKALEDLTEQACARVWRKWDGSGDAASAAQDWAMDLIAEYAEADGVELVDSYAD